MNNERVIAQSIEHPERFAICRDNDICEYFALNESVAMSFKSVAECQQWCDKQKHPCQPKIVNITHPPKNDDQP